MKFKRLLVATLFTLSLTACDSNEPFSEGTDYRELGFVNKSKTPQVVLFFSAACPHCYKFDKLFETWVIKKPKDVIVERIPVNFGHESWKSLQQTYATMRALNIQDEMSLAMFEAVQDKKIWLGDELSVSSWLSSHGYDVNKAREAFNSERVNDLLGAYYASEARYKVRDIPRLIVNGKYEIKIKQIKGETADIREAKLKDIIDYLLVKEEE